MPTDEDHYYVALGDGRYQPTRHTQGAWSEHEQHMAAITGLLVHALERHDPRPDLQWARLTFDILGVIHLSETTIRTTTIRPGRTIELVEAVASAGGRDVVRLSAWRLTRTDTSSVAVAEAPLLPDPESVPVWDGMDHWGGNFLQTLEFRAEPGHLRPGRGQVWVRSGRPLVAGEESTDLARWCGLLDVANGIVGRQSPSEWLFPNVDLTLHLHRAPTGPWAGFDTQVSWGPTGIGQSSSAVHDVEGPVGTVEQSLTVRPRP
ncbi:thioesterase family protein [Ornithinimicrobium humiphilum]|uniref:Thioesterase superfamily protein n=1 Tax=Ornithinimicrobium humiphilum TaxID=125288 RepID=A0A543K831_9MICO|nr:thioesterase family protein [Ornithinimicrobium humiphilum]TQM91248.1 thioesterase superfamily protein [Ornithinimicrobium humiphilum]